VVGPSATAVQDFVAQVSAVKAAGSGERLAPWILSEQSQGVLRALCDGLEPLFSDHTRRSHIGEAEDRVKFDAAVGRLDLVAIALQAVLDVLHDPRAHLNLCAARGKDGRGKVLPYASRAVAANVFGDENHPSVRYTLYAIVKSKVGYGGGARVPLPATLETLLRAAFPCSPQGLFDGTGFIASQPRGAAAAAADGADSSSGAAAGAAAASARADSPAPVPGLPPLYPAAALAAPALAPAAAPPAAPAPSAARSNPPLRGTPAAHNSGASAAVATASGKPQAAAAVPVPSGGGGGGQGGKKRPRCTPIPCTAAQGNECGCTACLARGAFDFQ
jgi:hypothetical protein